ncbi:MAG: biotin--[acetyl-CoA-carboxylase] ligase [Flavobacteriaceae bacterium]|nr:biotin--[acetyl-CoA-carboxylase] ligase [Flavobacteriaceae bacterium]|tara:strand:+ start:9579 stop:10316 length:738 start_codon:yes stop_codon:yes gene_type:complete
MHYLNLRKLNATPSTNLELKNCLKLNKINSGDVFWSLNQTHGRGQNNSIWLGEVNKHLAFSLFSRFKKLKYEWLYAINAATSLAVLNTLSSFSVPNLSIKWPNDILSGNKKICGILIENQINKKEIKSIIGIGINLYQESFDRKLPNATSIFIETKKKIIIDDFLNQLSVNLETFLGLCIDSSINELNSLFHKKLFAWNKKVKFKKDNKIFVAKISKVQLNGLIELEFDDGSVDTYYAKQLKMIY